MNKNLFQAFSSQFALCNSHESMINMAKVKNIVNSPDIDGFQSGFSGF